MVEFIKDMDGKGGERGEEIELFEKSERAMGAHSERRL
jgi:hypothetical protein